MNEKNITERAPRKIGYARVSTCDQCLDLQTDSLKLFGCDEIFCDDGLSGGIHPHKRGGFQSALQALQKNDALVVWKLDRLGRTLKGVIDTVDALKADNVQFISVTENIDTSTATGRAFWQFIGLMAELERGLISERTIEGIAAAKRRGVKFGRPRKLSERVVLNAKVKIEGGEATVSSVARKHGVNPATVRRALSALEKC